MIFEEGIPPTHMVTRDFIDYVSQPAFTSTFTFK